MVTVLITGAGSGGAENLITDLWYSHTYAPCPNPCTCYPIRIVGTNINRYLLLKSHADVTYHVPPAGNPYYIDTFNDIIDDELVDLIIPNNDREVRYIGKHRKKLNCRTFLPSNKAIEICQDKSRLYKKLRSAGIDVPEFTEVSSAGELQWDTAWVRMKTGSGSRGSLPVDNVEELEAWVNWWCNHRDARIEDFIVCEYLPGRDYAVQSLWKDGECILLKACERLEYIFAKNMPQGSSSSPAIARTVDNPLVTNTCLSAVRAIDKNANGMWSIDLKEDISGTPHITEINIGRFCMITPIFDRVGRYNMAKVYVDLAMDYPVNIPPEVRLGHDIEDAYLIRELDTLPLIHRIRRKDVQD